MTPKEYDALVRQLSPRSPIGTAVKMFTVAGPVIVFGTAASVVYGVILCLLA